MAQVHLARANCNWNVKICDDIIPPIDRDEQEVFELINCSDPLCNSCTDVYDDFEVEAEHQKRSERTFVDLLIPQAPTSSLGHDDGYLLLPSRVLGYSLSSHEWYPLRLDCLRKIHPIADSIKENVIMPTRQKQLMEAFAKSWRHPKFGGEQGQSNALSQQHSGGARLLFHGPPGVGKSSTARALGDLFAAPILEISAANLEFTPRGLKDKLGWFILLATQWRLTLVLDAADTILGARNQHDEHGSFLLNSKSKTQRLGRIPV
jgi:hypothetical protein